MCKQARSSIADINKGEVSGETVCGSKNTTSRDRLLKHQSAWMRAGLRAGRLTCVKAIWHRCGQHGTLLLNASDRCLEYSPWAANTQENAEVRWRRRGSVWGSTCPQVRVAQVEDHRGESARELRHQTHRYIDAADFYRRRLDQMRFSARKKFAQEQGNTFTVRIFLICNKTTAITDKSVRVFTIVGHSVVNCSLYLRN